jgi:hypothetical protein
MWSQEDKKVEAELARRSLRLQVRSLAVKRFANFRNLVDVLVHGQPSPRRNLW